ncbi:MAG: galactose-1-phosphate uridylyltransferase [Dehalococcoidia bacterium]|nr:galactose-1-phosphate uridylyltransferase [Dehalococcoidia bacterium]
MSELRRDPLRGEWVVTATHRMERPQMPDEWCPFCPGSGLVPDDYDVYLYSNDFPSFASPPPPMSVSPGPGSVWDARPSWGACDVVLYHPDHDRDFLDIDMGHLVKLAALWQKRYLELFQNKRVKYVLIFENSGEEIGVTIPHPHGQIYAFPLVPPVPGAEMRRAKSFKRRTGRCLHCRLIEEEARDGRRMVFDENGWAAFVPFAARWPYEVHLYPRRCAGHLGELSYEELRTMMSAIKRLLATYRNYYQRAFPYMMLFHQAPPRGSVGEGTHMHIEFCPIRRSREKLKYRAGCETGAGIFINDSHPEEKAAELRSLLAGPHD